ncbi:hypothetical protein MUK42_10474 [Musa troglodytarum]|uniref:Protein kinase domain-containing protein n=1 Tax=Musa troglodytarum TaxID=320322 RepID=A0A9E7GPI3_9LILI|nr:hypothetical protein MUK42_10474 [Musa troglodytarum]
MLSTAFGISILLQVVNAAEVIMILLHKDNSAGVVSTISDPTLSPFHPYRVATEVGDGTFGTVWQAINKQSGEVVAIKKMKIKYYSWEECLNLREVKSLRRLNHPKIIKLKEVIRENDTLYLVFEYMECNLYQLMKKRGKPFTEVEIRNWCFQIFQALAYMHQRGYFHRDLKPENILVTKNILKIADFGLAREVSSKPPFTEYVSTRWYRAPEVLLKSSVYDSAVDMWAMGAIIAELFTLCPLFPGSSEADEIYKICSIIGPPNRNSWAKGLQLADAIKFQFPQVLATVPLSLLIPSASQDAVNLISVSQISDKSAFKSGCSRRPTSVNVLQHSFFQPCFYIPPSPRLRLSVGAPKASPSVIMKGALESEAARRYSLEVLSNARMSSNLSFTNVNESSRTGVQRNIKMSVQRNIKMSHQENKNERFDTNDTKPYGHQPAARNTPGYSRRTCNVVEKLAHSTVSPNRDSHIAGKAPNLNPLPAGEPPALKNQRTFRPKKSAPSGSKGAQLRKHIDATLGSGNLREAVRLPPGEDLNEWLAVNTVDFFNQVNLLYGTLAEFCTPENCPTMTAGPKYEYRWADGVQIKKPIEVSAPKYVEYLMEWIEVQLDDESIFPQKLGTPFPPNFKEVVKTIFKRLFRVYAHIYHSHFQKIVSLKEEAHLNTCFKHFILFTYEFGLIDKKELAPLQELIESIIVPY